MKSWGTDGNLYALHQYEKEYDAQVARDEAVDELRAELDDDVRDEILGGVLDCITVENVEGMSYEELGRRIIIEYERLAIEEADRRLGEMELYGEYY